MIKYLIQERDFILKFWKNIYIFGSSIKSKRPNDIDILLVYESAKLAESKIEIKKMRDALSRKFKELEFDFVVLNESELKQTQFLERINYKQIK